MASSLPSKIVVLDPLTFEICTLAQFPDVRYYGVKVFLQGERAPFLTRFAALGTQDDPETVAREILVDLQLAATDPDELWRRIEQEIGNIQADSMALKVVKQGFNRMVAWASERPDSIGKAFVMVGET